VTVQVPGVEPLPAGIERVAGRVIVLAPAAATTAPAPEHVVLAFGVAATTTPEGSASASAAESVATEVFALPSVSVSVEIAFGAMAAGVKLFARVGAAGFTTSVVGVTAFTILTRPLMLLASLP